MRFSLRRSKAVIPYLSYGKIEDDTSYKVRVLGRVVEESEPFEFSHSSNRIKHFLQVIKLFLTRKVPGETISAQFQDEEFLITSNDEGFFSEVIQTKPSASQDDAEQYLVNFHIRQKTAHKSEERPFPGRFVAPTPSTHCLIISDIDDTVLKSQATSFLRLAFKTLFFPVEKRKTFSEASDVYQSLKRGKTRESNNLVFYVSSSTWNLYPLLQGFLELNKFPTGPVILQDVASERKKNPENRHDHKLDRILEIAQFYPEIPMILIGDAGQRDPVLYLRAAELLGSQVQIILIRQTWWTKTTQDSEAFLKQAEHLGVKLLFFDDLSELHEELKDFMWVEQLE